MDRNEANNKLGVIFLFFWRKKRKKISQCRQLQPEKTCCFHDISWWRWNNWDGILTFKQGCETWRNQPSKGRWAAQSLGSWQKLLGSLMAAEFCWILAADPTSVQHWAQHCVVNKSTTSLAEVSSKWDHMSFLEYNKKWRIYSFPSWLASVVYYPAC